MRALSTILLVALLAPPAGAQILGFPRTSYDKAWWLGVEGGNVRGVSLSDGASAATWQLQPFSPIRVSLDYGRFERTIGISGSQAVVPLSFTGAACSGCTAQVTVRQALGRYRIVSPFFGTGLYAVTDLSAGITNWSGLKGRSATLGDVGAATNDFTYGLSLGLVLPLGERLQLTGAYGSLQFKHDAKGSVGSQTVSFNTVRFGAQWRLSQ